MWKHFTWESTQFYKISRNPKFCSELCFELNNRKALPWDVWLQCSVKDWHPVITDICSSSVVETLHVQLNQVISDVWTCCKKKKDKFLIKSTTTWKYSLRFSAFLKLQILDLHYTLIKWIFAYIIEIVLLGNSLGVDHPPLQVASWAGTTPIPTYFAIALWFVLFQPHQTMTKWFR